MFGNSERIIAVADVGSGSAGVSIIAAKQDATRVLAASRSILSLEERTKDQIMTGVVRMLTEASAEVQKLYHDSPAGKYGAPREVYAIVHSPWSRAVTARVSENLGKDGVIVSKELITQVAQRTHEDTQDLDRSHILESTIVRVELNGYPTSAPAGKRARQLDVTTFMSDCEPTMHEGVRAALESAFPGREINIRSGARTYLAIVQRLLEKTEAYVIVNMVSEATTVMAIREGTITHHAIIEEGVRTIVRRITGAKGTPEETASIMRMVVAGSCSGDECDKLNEALGKAEGDMVRIFGEGLASLMGKQRMPNTLVLFAHPDIAPWLARLFSRIDFAQFTIPLQPFVVTVATADMLKSSLHIESDVPADAGILVDSAFVNMQASGR